MKTFYIEYKDVRRAYYAVEADDEQEALDRFEEWLINSEEVYNILDNSDDIASEYYIDSCERANEDTTLTNERYREEVIEGNWILDKYRLRCLWGWFGDVPLNYPADQYPDDEPLPDGVNESTDPDGELAEDWFIFEAGTPKMEIWHWFDDNYPGGIVELMRIGA